MTALHHNSSQYENYLQQLIDKSLRNSGDVFAYVILPRYFFGTKELKIHYLFVQST